MTLKQARNLLRPIGVKIDHTSAGDYRVNLAHPNDEATAYYTEDLDDAVVTGRIMARKAYPGLRVMR